DARKTASPNAGHPMSAAAGLLGVRLEKRGDYVLGEGLRAPSVDDVESMLHLFRCTVLWSIAIPCVAWLLYRGLQI
ncbi:MAG: cobalamin biosynthesis protein, partial [Planctomycetota bacterium]